MTENAKCVIYWIRRLQVIDTLKAKWTKAELDLISSSSFPVVPGELFEQPTFLFRPILEYGLIYACTSKSYLDKLERVHLSGLRPRCPNDIVLFKAEFTPRRTNVKCLASSQSETSFRAK
ncbi:hypothetical protein TNCV_277221 [Trichonephila clavipes]|uniref:Uncharacterized protein n=1 Tax=Trichonephila clavipes TaxID=2585209 RepID=A0A8X6VIF2_TRICX|nr:hypothetical protein TNCV_277221 [Trichonephila clavipes]